MNAFSGFEPVSLAIDFWICNFYFAENSIHGQTRKQTQMPTKFLKRKPNTRVKTRNKTLKQAKFRPWKPNKRAQ